MGEKTEWTLEVGLYIYFNLIRAYLSKNGAFAATLRAAVSRDKRKKNGGRGIERHDRTVEMEERKEDRKICKFCQFILPWSHEYFVSGASLRWIFIIGKHGVFTE